MSGILYFETERNLSRISGPKLLFVLVSQADLPVLTPAPRLVAHEEAWGKGSLDSGCPRVVTAPPPPG